MVNYAVAYEKSQRHHICQNVKEPEEKDMTKLIAVFAMFVLTMAAIPASAQTQQYNGRYPMSGYLTYCDCTGEYVLFSGEIHWSYQLDTEPDGGYSGKGHFNYSGADGVGLVTGTKYIMGNVSNYRYDFDGFPFESSSVGYFNIITAGKSLNLRMKFYYHFKTDKDGVPTMDIIRSEFVCNGSGGGKR